MKDHSGNDLSMHPSHLWRGKRQKVLVRLLMNLPLPEPSLPRYCRERAEGSCSNVELAEESTIRRIEVVEMKSAIDENGCVFLGRDLETAVMHAASLP